MEKVCAYVLTGGKPEAFEPLTLVRNKAALPVFGMYRIIDFVLSNLMNSEIDNVGVITQYLPGSLIEHIGVGAPWDFVGYGRLCRVLPPFYDKISMQWYENPFDGIRKNLFFARITKAEDILVMSGEHIYKMDYRPLIDYHRMNKADVTVVVKKMPGSAISGKMGLVTFKNDGRVVSFTEKPEKVGKAGFASVGIYLFNYRAFYELFENLDLSGDRNRAGQMLLDALKQYKVYAYITNEEWYGLRDLEEYYRVQLDFLEVSRMAELDMWNVRTSLEDRNTGFRPASVIGNEAKVINTLLPKGCRVYGTVKNSVLSPGVYVEPGAYIENSIIFHDVVVKNGAHIQRAIIDKDVEVGSETRIGEEGRALTIIGKGAVIKSGTFVQSGTTIKPMEYVR